MDFLFSKNNTKKNIKMNLTPSAGNIQSAGKSLKNAVHSAKSVAEALNVVSAQLAEASNSLRKNAPALANAAADLAKSPATVAAVEPLVGSGNAMALRNIPKTVIAGGFRKVANDVAVQIDVLSNAAVDAANAVNDGLKKVQEGAEWVQDNAPKVDLDMINDGVNKKANYAINRGVVGGFNSVLNHRVLPNVDLRASLNSQHTRAVQSVARELASEARKASSRKYRKNVTRKNRKDAKKGGFSFF